MLFNLAKPVANPTVTSYIVDIPTDPPSQPLDKALINQQQQQQQQQQQPESSSKVSDISVVEVHASALSDFTDFRKAMDGIPIEDHELPPAFQSFKDIKRKSKPYLSKDHRRAIDRLWEDYRTKRYLNLTRGDYVRLMRIFRYSSARTVAARRILELQKDMSARGMIFRGKLYEMVLQAHIVQGTVQESIQIYQEVTAMLGEGTTVEHKRVLWTMVDAFVANQRVPEGIKFLDQLPIVNPVDGSRPPLRVDSLYRRLFFRPYSPNVLSPPAPPPFPPHTPLGAIQEFTERLSPPQQKDALRILKLLESHSDGIKLLSMFSKTSAGLLIKLGQIKSVSSLISNLVLSRQLEEVARVLDLTLRHGMELDMDQIRLDVLRFLDTQSELGDNLKDVVGSMDQWDTIAIQHTKPLASSMPDLSDPSTSLTMFLTTDYSRLMRECIEGGEFREALRAAKYIRLRNWAPHEINSHQLCSWMVNYGRSSNYSAFLQVGYALGGPLTPNLHTYRRLVYAACRRSDLHSAITLLEQVRMQHPDWKFDATFYNSIISTAAATKHIRVAEKAFACLLEDGIPPDYFSFHGLLNGYGETGDLKAALMIPERMLKHKLNPTTKTFNLVMKAYLIARKDLTTSSKLFRAMQHSEQSVPPNLITFNRLLDGYRRVGNTTWFDAFFDQHFGPEKEVVVQSADCKDMELELEDPVAQQSRPFTRKNRKADMGNIRSKKSDDQTLLIQLKYSLALPNVDLQTVRTLWRIVESRLVPIPAHSVSEPSSAASPDSDNDIELDSSQSTQSSHPSSTSPYSRIAEDILPPTHVPFQKWLNPTKVPATDAAYVRFTALALFRSAFRSRGDIAGVKRIDQLLAEFFPEHPQGETVIQRRAIKYIRKQTRKNHGQKKKQNNADKFNKANKTNNTNNKVNKANNTNKANNINRTKS
ncbi:hypothetical protein BGZ65_000198 [Modicella reniformis]|uniref:Pentatricopeptide repeat-containing protein-mitochondrial domain-containing protein n=1 Tax=Modicella reniformis TaxID=1440133 RepID=A0A9P6IMF3_9FUNG|nr:hypothetical protein BGZ65_000198 [Modicella reniformis]